MFGLTTDITLALLIQVTDVQESTRQVLNLTQPTVVVTYLHFLLTKLYQTFQNFMKACDNICLCAAEPTRLSPCPYPYPLTNFVKNIIFDKTELVHASIACGQCDRFTCGTYELPLPSLLFFRSAGRPKSVVSADDIKPLLDLRVPLTVIAKRLGIGHTILYKKITQFGLELPKYTSANKEELTNKIQSIKRDHPNCGEKMVSGHLRSRVVYVQCCKVREIIRDVDPDGVEARWKRALQRREYSVPCPLYLVHVDGNHKLIRYRIVIHLGIDGYSRTVVYADASDNNRSTTVQRLFLGAVETYGFPINIRSDLGGENVLVWRRMHSHWGTARRSVILGSSMHNQRVERLNRDVNVNIAHVFNPKLQELEDLGLLDVNNETDMFCLHYVLLPRVKRSLQEFVYAHNNHGLRTEGNLSPLQLLHLNSHLTSLHQTTISSIPGEGLPELIDDVPRVEVPRTECPLTNEEYLELERQIDPLSDTPLLEIFHNTLQFVGQKLISQDVQVL